MICNLLQFECMFRGWRFSTLFFTWKFSRCDMYMKFKCGFHRTKLNPKFCLISFARWSEHFSFRCLPAILSLPENLCNRLMASRERVERDRKFNIGLRFETWNFSCYSNTRQRLKLIRLRGQRLGSEGEFRCKVGGRIFHSLVQENANSINFSLE